MNILFRYIFKKFLFILLGLSFIIIGTVWLTQSLRFIEIVVNHNISLKSYFSLILCLIPDLFSITLPICLLISCLYIYYKLKIDHEIQVLYALGLSPFRVALPLLFLSATVTLLISFTNIYITPLSFKYFRNLEYQIRNQFSASWVREGSFNFIKGTTIYVREHALNGQLKGIFIYNPQSLSDTSPSKKNLPYTIIAELGSVEKKEDGLFIILKKGVRQERDPITGKISEFSFDILKYHLPLDEASQDLKLTKPYEKSLKELFWPPQSTDPELAKKMKIEAHQRILLPWISIVNGLLGSVFMLLGNFNRKQRKYKITLAGIFSLVIHISVYMFLNLSLCYSYTLYIAYSTIILLIFMLIGILKLKFIPFDLLIKKIFVPKV